MLGFRECAPPPRPEAEKNDDDDDDDEEEEEEDDDDGGHDDDNDDDHDGLATIIISGTSKRTKKNNASKQIHLKENAKELGWWDLNLRAHYQSHPRHPAILKSLRGCIVSIFSYLL